MAARSWQGWPAWPHARNKCSRELAAKCGHDLAAGVAASLLQEWSRARGKQSCTILPRACGYLLAGRFSTTDFFACGEPYFGDH